MILLVLVLPAYAEVISLNIDKINYMLSDEIIFLGLEEGPSGLVSVVIRDPIDVVKNRLARGKITVEEYNQLTKALE